MSKLKLFEEFTEKNDLIGKTIVIHDCANGKNTIMGEYEITGVEGDSTLILKDYPTPTHFAKSEDFAKFAEGQVAFIHPDEVYAYIKPEIN